MSVKLGFDAKLYRNAGTYASPSWCAVTNVQYLTLRDASLEFQMFWDTKDDDLNFIGKAFVTNTTIEFAVLSGANNAAGSQPLRATMVITHFSRFGLAKKTFVDYPPRRGLSISVTAKPTYIDTTAEGGA